MKIRELYIENYKMFNDFKIDFLGSEDKPLDIVVLAGVNGSGKTTFLECINAEVEGEINLALLNEPSVHNYFTIVQDYIEGVEAFPAGIDSITKVADEFVKTFYYFFKEKDYRPSEITEHFRNYIKEIFNDLDKEDNVWFTTKRNQEYYYTGKDNGADDNFFTIDDLSTGQKTLLPKVLYLYFKDYNDKVILIDEPELSLHPSWQNRVLKIYENFAKLNNCQIILATHSPHIIGSAKSESIRLLSKEGEKIEVVDSFSNTYGTKFSQILTDVMGVEYLRVPIVAQKFDNEQRLLLSKALNQFTNLSLDEIFNIFSYEFRSFIKAIYPKSTSQGATICK